MADDHRRFQRKPSNKSSNERYPLDKWEDSNYSILDKFSMRGRKGFDHRSRRRSRTQRGGRARPSRSRRRTSRPAHQEDKLTELAKDMSERFGTNVIALTCDVTNVDK